MSSNLISHGAGSDDFSETRSDIDTSVDRIRAASVRQFADWVAGIRSEGDTLDLDELRILVNAYASTVEAGEL